MEGPCSAVVPVERASGDKRVGGGTSSGGDIDLVRAGDIAGGSRGADANEPVRVCIRCKGNTSRAGFVRDLHAFTATLGDVIGLEGSAGSGHIEDAIRHGHGPAHGPAHAPVIKHGSLLALVSVAGDRARNTRTCMYTWLCHASLSRSLPLSLSARLSLCLSVSLARSLSLSLSPRTQSWAGASLPPLC